MSRSPKSFAPAFSLEYFPANGPSAESALMNGAHALAAFRPAFQSMTFGANGSEENGSLDWSDRLQTLTEVSTACHVALCRFNRSSFLQFAAELWARGVTRMVILRGDVPADAEDNGLAGFESVAEAVAAAKALHPFDISVSAYPEVHPRAASANADLDVLLAKQEAGADRAITQYFFDNEDFYRFRDRAEEAGLRIPLVPGIMPIANFERIKRFSENCGASVPARFGPLFAAAGEDRAEHTKVSRGIVEEQVCDLVRNGVDAIHIYTLNRVDLAADAIRAFRSQFEGQGETKRLRAVA